MKTFRADLHIHTVLSPCGDLDMSPVNIISRAREMKLDIIGITDHNSTLQARLLRELGEKAGIMVIPGAEVTTKEEVHCLALFDNEGDTASFQEFLELHLPEIPNDINRFGHQLVVDENDMIVRTEEKLLISALDCSIEVVADVIHRLNGLFIPAHIDKQRFSILIQLGFVPADLAVDALEISPFSRLKQFSQLHSELSHYSFISNSDAHYLNEIGRVCNVFEMENASLDEIRKTFKGIGGRKSAIVN